MNAYMVGSNRKVEPFGEHPRECLICNRTLSSHQKDALAAENTSLVPVADLNGIQDDGEYLVFDDYLYFTPELLREFLERSRKMQCPTVAALKPGVSKLRCMAATQSVERYADRSLP